jgi:phage FluMu protein Com
MALTITGLVRVHNYPVRLDTEKAALPTCRCPDCWTLLHECTSLSYQGNILAVVCPRCGVVLEVMTS